jgi:hypothetical protein
MYRQLTQWQKERVDRQPGEISHGEISDQELEALRVLGYVDEAEGSAFTSYPKQQRDSR